MCSNNGDLNNFFEECMTSERSCSRWSSKELLRKDVYSGKLHGPVNDCKNGARLYLVTTTVEVTCLFLHLTPFLQNLVLKWRWLLRFFTSHFRFAHCFINRRSHSYSQGIVMSLVAIQRPGTALCFSKTLLVVCVFIISLPVWKWKTQALSSFFKCAFLYDFL